MGEELKQILSKIESLETKFGSMETAMAQMGSDLRAEIRSTEENLRAEIKSTENILLTKITEVDTKLTGEIGQVRIAILEMSDDVEAILDMYKEHSLKINKLANKIKAG